MLIPLLQNLYRSRWRRGLIAGSGPHAALYAEVLRAIAAGKDKKPSAPRKKKIEEVVYEEPLQASESPIRRSGLFSGETLEIPQRLAEYGSLYELILRQRSLELAILAMRIAEEIVDEEEVLLLLLAEQ